MILDCRLHVTGELGIQESVDELNTAKTFAV